MTIVKDDRSLIEIVRDLQVAVCKTDKKVCPDNHAIFHEVSNSLEIKEPRLLDPIQDSKSPLYSEEELFAMARNQLKNR